MPNLLAQEGRCGSLPKQIRLTALNILIGRNATQATRSEVSDEGSDTVATTSDTGAPGRRGSGTPAGGAAQPPILDTYVDNRTQPKWEPLPDAPLEVHPDYCRSALDRNGGGRSRYRVCRRTFDAILRGIESQAVHGMVPYCLHLTIDRDQWTNGKGFHELDGARHAHQYLTDHIRHVMRRCGVTHWLRVLEFQSKSGCGWSHWHCVAFFPASMSANDVQVMVHRRWLGVQGGRIARIHPAQKRGGKWDLLAGYFAKYVSKGSDAVPPWLDHPDILALRTYSMSRALGEMVRDRPRRPVSLRSVHRRPRTLLPLFLRLARSGSAVTLRRQCMNTQTGEVRALCVSKPLLLPPESRMRAHDDGVFVDSRYPQLPRRDRHGLVSAIRNESQFAVWLSWFADVIADDASRYERSQREILRERWYEHQRKAARVGCSPPSRASEARSYGDANAARGRRPSEARDRPEGGAAPPGTGT